MIDLSNVYRNSSFDQWSSVVFFFIIHLANLRSVKIVHWSQWKVREKSGKSQGVFQLLMSGKFPDTGSSMDIHVVNYRILICLKIIVPVESELKV